jgi:hypothetical protein
VFGDQARLNELPKVVPVGGGDDRLLMGFGQGDGITLASIALVND